MAIHAGLQMYSVREAMRLDPLAALERCVQAGFTRLELPAKLKNDPRGLCYGKTAREWKQTADAAGAQITGGYVKDLSEENLEEAIEFFTQVSAQRVVIPIGYFPTREALDAKCRLYNALGRRCRESGLALYYENHYHEFQMMDGRTIFDLLLEQTSPDLFTIALNSYWLMRGLVDPLETLEKYSGRIGSLVQQDYPLSEIDKFNMWRFYRYHPIAENIRYENILQGNEIENIQPVQSELFCEIGAGILPLQPIIDLAGQYPNIDYVVLKQDYTRFSSEFDSVAESAKRYRQVRGVQWDV